MLQAAAAAMKHTLVLKLIDLPPGSVPSGWPANYGQWAVYFS